MDRPGLAELGYWRGRSSPWAASTPQDQQPQAKPAYTLAEYNAFRQRTTSRTPQAKVKALDDFVVKYPASALLQYVYFDYYHAYYALKNYPQTIEFADKLQALGDKVDLDRARRDPKSTLSPSASNLSAYSIVCG